jgi:hypothetical protein
MRSLVQREDEVETLADHTDCLQLEIEGIQQRREAESIERSESHAQIFEEREEREAVEDDLNAIRDEFAAATIELQQRVDELDLKNREIDDLIQEDDRVVEVVEQEWRGEVEEAGSQVEELRDVCFSCSFSSFLYFISTVLQVLAEREHGARELRLNITEFEANTNDFHAKLEVTLAHLEQEAEDKDAELRAANEEIEHLGKQVYALEEDAIRMGEEHERFREEEAAEREALEALASALKDVRPFPISLTFSTDVVQAESSWTQVSAPRPPGILRSIFSRHSRALSPARRTCRARRGSRE